MCGCFIQIHRRAVFILPRLCSLEISSALHTSKALQRIADLKLMGSFTSAHKILNEDTADNDLHMSEISNWDDLRSRCEEALACHPPKINRCWKRDPKNDFNQEKYVRIMQWNVLSQALAISSDKFVACPPEALSWWTRRWRLLEELVSTRPDILCLQEVDHFQFFKHTLGSIGFKGTFFAKPDSPCYYIPGNNGPDGCAIFVDETKFEILDTKTRSLEVWGYQSNQVVILCKIRRRVDNFDFWVATTHLKARQGPLLSTMRREQGKDLMEFVKLFSGSNAVIVTGDFNAIPGEPVYQAVIGDDTLPMDSAYRHLTNKNVEPPYTTWKIREDGEYCQTLDYIFYNKNVFKVMRLLEIPTVEDIGENRVPSYRYPSDHFSLVADLNFIDS